MASKALVPTSAVTSTFVFVLIALVLCLFVLYDLFDDWGWDALFRWVS